MTKRNIGVSLCLFRLPLREALIQASRIGVRGVQILPHGELAPENLSQTGRRALRRLLEGLDLKVASVAFPSRKGYNVAERLEERIAATKRALLLSYQLGGGVVTNQIGPLAEDPEDAGRALQTDSLEEIGRYAAQVGAVFAITPGAEPPARLRAFLEGLGGAGLAVNYDPAAVILAGFDPIEGVRASGPWIGHTDARDAVARASSDPTGEVSLGRGSLDWAEYLGALEEFDYHGWFMIQPIQGDDPVGYAARSVKYLESF